MFAPKAARSQHGSIGILELVLFGLLLVCVGGIGYKILTSKPITQIPASHKPPPESVFLPLGKVVTYEDNGKTFKLDKNQNLTIELNSSYWNIHESSDTNVIRLAGEPVIKGVLGGPGCAPGQGCGTVTAIFNPHAPGTATISASRRLCGEALLCTGDQGKFQITVITPALK